MHKKHTAAIHSDRKTYRRNSYDQIGNKSKIHTVLHHVNVQTFMPIIYLANFPPYLTVSVRIENLLVRRVTYQKNKICPNSIHPTSL